MFGSRNKLKSKPCLTIKCNDEVINSTNSVKYLGATIDQQTDGVEMVKMVLKRQILD